MDRNYRDAVVREIQLVSNSLRSKDQKVSLRSLYFGGGTPSLAPVETIRSILTTLLDEDQSYFVLEPEAEITIEMDPGTFSLEQLQSLKELGVNRVSLGVQSFDNAILENIGRVHRVDDIYDSLSMLESVFGKKVNYSMDLISGLPGLSLAFWAETLERATTLSPQPTHLSLYDLQIESGTVFGTLYEEDPISASTTTSAPPLPSAEDAAFMYKYASGYLRAKKYEHYEISSYARMDSEKSHRSQHNQIYWNPQGQWYAVGLGATSSVDGKRFARPRAMMDYIQWVDQQERSSLAVLDWLPNENDLLADTVNALDTSTDIVMTRLLTMEGLDLEWADRNLPGGAAAVLRGASLGLDLGLAVRAKSKDGHEYLRLTDPDGFVFSNSIISSIFVELGVEE